MQSEKEALFQAILANPDDDDVRLVYADWLEEHGEPERAEFIRVQIELAKLNPRNDGYTELRVRAEHLKRRHGRRWQNELGPLEVPGVEWGRWHRGFVDELVIQDRFRHTPTLDLADKVLARIPFSRLVLWPPQPSAIPFTAPLFPHVRELLLRFSPFHDVARHLAEILRRLELHRLTHLEIDCVTLSNIAYQILATLRLPFLRSFRLTGSQADADAGALASAAWLPQLDGFALHKQKLSECGLTRLCERLCPERLRSLTLEAVALNDGGITTLCESGLLQGIAELHLKHNLIGTTGTQTLLKALSSTATLSLDKNPLGVPGLSALLHSPFAEQLPVLDFNGDSVDNQLLTTLAQTRLVPRLQHLIVANGALAPEAVAALLNSPRRTGLHSVILPNNGLETFPPCHLPDLGCLVLDENRLTGAGLTEFCANSSLPGLDLLSLSDNPLGTLGITALAQAHAFPRLAELSLINCGVDNNGVQALLESELLSHVKALFVETGNSMSAAAFAALRRQAAALGCKVE